jgi:hypothetical protein
MDKQEQNEVQAIVADELATTAATRLTEIARELRKLVDRVDELNRTPLFQPTYH